MQTCSYCILDFVIIRVVTAVLQANHNEVSLQYEFIMQSFSL
jgi:hypothetical protein